MSMRRRELLVTIVEEEARLTSLEADLVTARGRLAGLRVELHDAIPNRGSTLAYQWPSADPLQLHLLRR